MKHVGIKQSRFLALLLTAALLFSLPVSAFEEWDNEEISLGFESSLGEDTLSFTEEPFTGEAALAFNVEDALT